LFGGDSIDARADIFIKVPSNLSMPNASHFDKVIVCFQCGDGSLDFGNVATNIKRR
jgi:hypothetical protein